MRYVLYLGCLLNCFSSHCIVLHAIYYSYCISMDASVFKQVKIETVTEVLAIVEEHSLIEDKTAVPGELNPASAGVESQDEVCSQAANCFNFYIHFNPTCISL